MVTETCKKGIEHAMLTLETEDAKESEDKRATVIKLLIEFHEMLFHQYSVMKDVVNQLQTAREFCDLVKSHRGPMSREYAEALYLKAKALFIDPESPTSTAFTTVKKACHIWKNIPLSGGPKDLNHAMTLILKAQILTKAMHKYRWAVKVYQ